MIRSFTIYRLNAFKFAIFLPGEREQSSNLLGPEFIRAWATLLSVRLFSRVAESKWWREFGGDNPVDGLAQRKLLIARHHRQQRLGMAFSKRWQTFCFRILFFPFRTPVPTDPEFVSKKKNPGRKPFYLVLYGSWKLYLTRISAIVHHNLQNIAILL